MADGGDDELPDDDETLWADFTQDVTPLKDQDGRVPAESSFRKKLSAFLPKKRHAVRNTPPDFPGSPGGEQRASELDRHTDERLRKGQMRIEARLDLHGLNRHEALEALTRFIRGAYDSGRRCVLVVTGKGQEGRDPLAPEAGILRRQLPEWLDAPSLKPFVLQVYPARPKDGGSGAFYILLRRRR